jgi:hypothetical protein
MAENRIVLDDIIYEETTSKITATLKDEDDVAVPASSLTTLTLTLFSISGDAYPIINSREGQDVKNDNNVTVDEDGLVTWSVQPEDTVIENSNLSTEDHRAVFEWTYNSGAKNGKYIIDMTIRNLQKTT